MTERERRRILLVMIFAFAVLLFAIGIWISGLIGGFFITIAIALSLIVCGYAIDEFNSKDNEEVSRDHYQMDDSLIQHGVKFRLGSGSDSFSSGSPTQPVEVDADLSRASAPQVPSSQTNNLLDAAVSRYSEGDASASMKLIEEATLLSPNEIVVWAARTALHVIRNECEDAMITKHRALHLDNENPASVLAAAFHDYCCLKISDSEVEEKVKIPVDETLVYVDSYQIPRSASIWRDEGLRQLKKGNLPLALRMFHCALIEFQHFPQAWEGVAIVFGLMGDERCEQSALSGKELSEKEEDIPDWIWAEIGLKPKSQWLQRHILYRIVYGTRFRLPVL